jgi:hypothetical protein
MKTLGIILVVIGVGFTIFSGFNYMNENKVVKIGNFEITNTDIDRFSWSPYAGIACLSLGGVILLLSVKEKSK